MSFKNTYETLHGHDLRLTNQQASETVLLWRKNSAMEMDTKIVRVQIASLNAQAGPPKCLDSLDRRLRDRGVGNCVDK